MTLSRQEIIDSYRQASEATEELTRWFNRSQLTAAKVRELLPRGAMTHALPLAAWRETMQDDQQELLLALLDGAEIMDRHLKVTMMELAARLGSPQTVSTLLDRGYGWTLTQGDTGHAAFFCALDRDNTEIAALMIDAGAPVSSMTKVTHGYSELWAKVKSPAMFDLLWNQGCRPTSEDMLTAALSPKEGPNPALLRSFLAAGVNTEVEGGVKVWNALLHNEYRNLQYREAQVDCAKQLLAAGASRESKKLYGLPGMLVALDAGLSPSEVPGIQEIWMGSLKTSDFFIRKDFMPTENPSRDMLLMIADLIEQVADRGVEIDWLEVLGPHRHGNTAEAFALAGAFVDHGVQLEDEDKAIAQAARLRRTCACPIKRTPARRI